MGKKKISENESRKPQKIDFTTEQKPKMPQHKAPFIQSKEPVKYTPLKYTPKEEISSREYEIYKEEERIKGLPVTLYEKACKIAEKIIRVDPGKKSREKLQEAIDFAHLGITPRGASSLPLFVGLLGFLITTIFVIIPFIRLPLGYAVVIYFLIVISVLYLYYYPYHTKKVYRITAGSEMVSMILYIAMYMRNIPNMENAVIFASDNLYGRLGLELKKLTWDMQTGKYVSIEEGLNAYIIKWKNKKEFVEAMELIKSSMSQPTERRLKLLDEAVNVMLAGNRENAKHFNQDLKLPVMIVHAMGIVLPVMGLVLFPIVTVFLHVGPEALFIAYDIILPLILLFVISNILDTRPSTFSKIDISKNPNVPPNGKFYINKEKKIYAPAWPLGLLVFILMTVLGAYLLSMPQFGQNDVLPAVLIVGGISFGIAVYYLLLSRDRIKIRNDTRDIEAEFAESLFQIGNEIKGGVPVELSIDRSIKRLENMKIKQLFYISLKNMKNLGMTFGASFFDKEYGALRYYSSRLIKSVIKTIVESSYKGVVTAANAMISVSEYLKGLHLTQEEVKEQLSDVVNSLKFQAYFLTPMVSGIIVTMAIIIISILKNLGERISAGGTLVSVPFLSQITSASITPFQFVVVVGFYLIETSLLLAIFINGIESSEDPIGRHQITGNALIIGFIVFSIFLYASLIIFQPLISFSI